MPRCLRRARALPVFERQALCPVDLRKIQLTLDQAKVNGKDTPPVDLLARQRGLVAFFDAHGLVDDARFGRA